jgi:hypothetical protein
MTPRTLVSLTFSAQPVGSRADLKNSEAVTGLSIAILYIQMVPRRQVVFGVDGGTTASVEKKFFASFFKKEALAFLGILYARGPGFHQCEAGDDVGAGRG